MGCRNTVQRFSRSAEKSAEITGINLDLIQFGVILSVLSNGHEIYINTVEVYSLS